MITLIISLTLVATASFFIIRNLIMKNEKLGQLYKFNTDIPAMKIPERSLFLLQEIGCKVTQN